jgi:hypothetical protein
MTDWVDDLDKLKRRPPSKNIAQTIVRVMVSASDDRTTAILAAALVETSLIGPIALVTRSPYLEKEFWLPRRLLSLDFKDRIGKASAVGLIGPNTTNNLEVIRHVRNAFAYSLSEIEFTTPEVERACALLTPPPKKDRYATPEPTIEPRYRYCIACDAVFQAMLLYVARLGLPAADGLDR